MDALARTRRGRCVLEHIPFGYSRAVRGVLQAVLAYKSRLLPAREAAPPGRS